MSDEACAWCDAGILDDTLDADGKIVHQFTITDDDEIVCDACIGI